MPTQSTFIYCVYIHSRASNRRDRRTDYNNYVKAILQQGPQLIADYTLTRVPKLSRDETVVHSIGTVGWDRKIDLEGSNRNRGLHLRAACMIDVIFCVHEEYLFISIVLICPTIPLFQITATGVGVRSNNPNVRLLGKKNLNQKELHACTRPAHYNV